MKNGKNGDGEKWGHKLFFGENGDAHSLLENSATGSYFFAGDLDS
jgi:hypothetical protein